MILIYNVHSLLFFFLTFLGLIQLFHPLRLFAIKSEYANIGVHICDIAHPMHLSLSKYHHRAGLNDLRDIEAETYCAFLARTKRVTEHFLQKDLSLTQFSFRLLALLLVLCALIYSDGSCRLLDTATVNGWSVPFPDGGRMMKNYYFGFEFLSTQVLQNLFLSYLSLLFIKIFSRLRLHPEQKYTVFYITSLEFCWLAIGKLY